MKSMARNHSLLDGNERLALAATIALVGDDGHRLTLTHDEAYDLTMSVAEGGLNEVEDISEQLRRSLRPR